MLAPEEWGIFLLLVSTSRGNFLLEYCPQIQFLEHLLISGGRAREIHFYSVTILSADAFEFLESKMDDNFILRGE